MAASRGDTSADPADNDREGLARLPTVLLDDPLGFIEADHSRQRTICRALSRLAIDNRIKRVLANDIATALKHDLALHHRDEDDDLFPQLLNRALPEDDLGPILDQLGADHVVATATVGKIFEALSATGKGDHLKISGYSAELARNFAASEQRHLAIETAIVMVIARKRLKSSDLHAMSRSMKARRGVPV